MSAETISYVDHWQSESSALTSARKRGEELGATSPTATAAAAIAVLAAALRAKAVVEVGTGVGVSGLRILESMDADGILTTIDAEPNHQIAAKETFVEAGIVGGRARLITGNPAAVLPRLADGAYDLVVINDAGGEPESYFGQGLRLLRVGGAFVLNGALGKANAVTDESRRDSGTAALRSLGTSIKENEDLISMLLPLGNGLLIAIKQA